MRLIFQLFKLRTEPISEGIAQALLAEPYVAIREPNVRDESVGDFLRRRFGQAVTDNLASAFFHGIYAGDLYKLSARTLLSKLWYLEGRDRENEPGILLQMLPSIFQRRNYLRRDHLFFPAVLNNDKLPRVRYPSHPTIMADMVSVLGQASVYTFKSGLGQVTASLADQLSDNPNVSIRTSFPVEDVSFDKNQSKVQIRSGKSTDSFDYVVSTLGPGMTKKFLTSSASKRGVTPDPSQLKACDHSNVAVSVMVVNLYYKDPNLVPQSARGFGYLIPRSVPVDQNPERALGVIFGSETSGRPDTVVYMLDEGQDTAPGTKFTVMLGGHWWGGWAASDLPTEEEAIEMSRNLLRRHLGITQAPEIAKAQLNPSCIPQYPVGYQDYMASIHQGLMSEYDGRVKVAGPWWQGGVGMSHSIQKAREVAWAIEHQWDDQTGLEHYGEDETWYICDMNTGEMVKDPDSEK